MGRVALLSRSLLLSGGIATAAALSVPSPVRALVGPTTDGATVAPIVVMVLQRSGATAGFCSGIVLARRAVLTAAHCVPPGADLRIHFKDATGAPVLLRTAEISRHPDYRPDAVRSRSRSIDLAIIRLAEPLPERFRPATIGGDRPDVHVGTLVRIAGYGVTREGDGTTSGRLRMADLTLRAPLSNVLLWAEDAAGAGACEGDSGGPVFAASGDAVAALTVWSAGEGRAKCGALTQALWLAPLKPWIEGVLGRWGVNP